MLTSSFQFRGNKLFTGIHGGGLNKHVNSTTECISLGIKWTDRSMGID